MSMNASGSVRFTPPRAANEVTSADLRKKAPSPSVRGLGVGLSRALAEADADASGSDASEDWDDERLQGAISNASAAPAPPGSRPVGPFGDEADTRGAQRGNSNTIGGRAAANVAGGAAAANTDTSDGFAAGFAAATAARRQAMAQFSEERAASVADKRAAAALLDPAGVTRFGLAAKMREGHGLGVYSVAWADDGRHLASCSHDGSVVVWDTEKLSVRRTYKGHSGPVYQVVFSPLGDNDRLASCGEDGSIRIWAKRSGKQLYAFRDLGVATLSCAFSHDGSLLAGSGMNGSIYVWNIEELEFAGEVQGGIVGGLSSPDLSAVAARLPSAFELRLLALDHYPESGDGHSGAVRRVAWSPNDDFLASAGDDRAIKIWAVAGGGALARELLGHTGAVHDLSFSREPAGARLASASADGTVCVWAWRTTDSRGGGGGPLLTLRAPHVGVVYSVAWLPQREYDGAGIERRPAGPAKLLSGGHDRSVVIWDADAGIPLCHMPGIHSSWVLGVSPAPDGGSFATASGDRIVGLWTALGPTLAERMRAGLGAFVASLVGDCVTALRDVNKAGGKKRGGRSKAARGAGEQHNGRTVSLDDAVVASAEKRYSAAARTIVGGERLHAATGGLSTPLRASSASTRSRSSTTPKGRSSAKVRPSPETYEE